MGNRANICVIQSRQGKKVNKIYLYGHWEGSRYVEAVERGLLKYPGRQSDPSYLTRIIFEEFVGDQFGKETGFGISCILYDSDKGNPVCIVDIPKQKVYFDNDKSNTIDFKDIKTGTLRAMMS